MEVLTFAVLVTPFIIVFYLAVLLIVRPSRAVLLSSLLGGLILGVVNFLFDLAASSAHWWHYNLTIPSPQQKIPFDIPAETFTQFMSHLPFPYYLTPILIFGSLAYMVIWKLWRGPKHRIAQIVLFGVPVFCILRDILVAQSGGTYATSWDSPIAPLMVVLMWLIGFFVGYLVFKKLSPTRESVEARRQAEHERLLAAIEARKKAMQQS
ncbi:hypothetical protein EI42_03770 [Thermosporothrix hazakensis]|jgi:hypothetical protein|uniref:Uncharacterized protein n=2 Tax=Thermosporothrix TaxID=768650 RepID=A0A326U531_THEHA|nr:hypothetical protein [Thermosporothrix hazakensis]PZW26618.1 hypothetical protein EI42_03770 [Thermosporothrix hazakensis]BBH89499.1 hypothetical protein KTC_42500 [Thermosporothrix sp. COM3]GCE47682.1 hypothetical protein KTH_25510 [Thermosporothrix hazakensis]